MFYTITNVQSEEPCRLQIPIDNPDGRLKVGLSQITFAVGWYNVQQGETIQYRENGGIIKTIQVAPGLYGLEDLKELIGAIDPAIQVAVNKLNGLVGLALGVGWELKMSDALLKMLGLDDGLGGLWLATGFYLGDRPINLVQQQKQLMIHLEQVNTTGNCLDGKPSSLLAMVPARFSHYGDIISLHFDKPEFKQLSCGNVPELAVSVKDSRGKLVDNHDLPICCTLEIKEG